MTRIYAIGDIHGRLDLMDELLEEIARDANGTPYQLVFLGDYVDRGKQSSGVIDRLMALQADPAWGENKPVALKGNHEQVMLDMIAEDFYWIDVKTWMKYGAPANIRSYGIRVPRDEAKYPDMLKQFQEAVASRGHVAYLQSLPLSYASDTHFFCHAGVDYDVPLDQQNEESLLWVRDHFLKSAKKAEKVVVHGHTISSLPVVQENRIGIDTGAYESGLLTAVVLEGSDPPRFVTTGGYTGDINRYLAMVARRDAQPQPVQ